MIDLDAMARKFFGSRVDDYLPGTTSGEFVSPTDEAADVLKEIIKITHRGLERYKEFNELSEEDVSFSIAMSLVSSAAITGVTNGMGWVRGSPMIGMLSSIDPHGMNSVIAMGFLIGMEYGIQISQPTESEAK